MVMNSIGIVTQLNPILGYEPCAIVAREALETGKSVYEIVVNEKRLISHEKWEEIFSIENLIHPKFINK
jgi:aspartate ammonia-lyase